MTIEIFMPALSPTMEVGTLAAWLVKEGDPIESGDVIAEIETDKATMEVESIDDGVMGKILVAEGAEDIPVGTPIAVMLEDGEDAGDIGEVSAAPEPALAPAPAAPAEVAPAPQPAQPAPAPMPAIAAPAANGDARIKASPLARRIAEQSGIDLSAIAGSGPGGRIIKRDIEGGTPVTMAAPAPSAASAPAPAAAPASTPSVITEPPADVPFTEVKLSNMRKVIARRLTEAKQTVPHFYLTIDVELDNLLAQRKELNAKVADQGVKISVNDFVIRACGLALKKVPAANAQFAGDVMYMFERADISVAVAIEGGLITPVIRGAEGKGLAAISAEMKDLATRARDGKLMPEEYQGGTFSISNLGMMGIREFSAVINPPQGAILAIGAGEQRPVVRDGRFMPATVMTCTLSCDHRVVDGAVGAEFLAAFKGLMEDPLTMLL